MFDDEVQLFWVIDNDESLYERYKVGIHDFLMKNHKEKIFDGDGDEEHVFYKNIMATRTLIEPIIANARTRNAPGMLTIGYGRAAS